MIYAKNSDAATYRGIHPNLDLALAHVTPEFLAQVGYDRVELKGNDVYATRFTYTTVSEEESFFEAHRKYLDIHIMEDGSEGVEIAPPGELQEFERVEDNDFYAYQGRACYVEQGGAHTAGGGQECTSAVLHYQKDCALFKDSRIF